MASNNKYDRQLRLWGAKGQRALSESTILLIQATAAGTETLKNLVLPGVGRFHILDDAVAEAGDIASNFFVVKDSKQPLPGVEKSNSRAQLACDHLSELNPDSRGTFQHEDDLNSIEDWGELIAGLESQHGTLVLASDLEPSLLEKVSAACHEMKVPLICVQSYGLIGVVRLQTPGMVLLDPKPTNSPPDLRLTNPIPGFVELAESIEWEKLQDHEHGHIPYPLILYRVAKEWKAAHDGQLPKSFAEKQEFRDAVKAKSRDLNKEVNFEEAVQNVYLAYTERTMDWLDEFGTNVEESSKLGQLIAGLRKFLDANSRPPLNGSIPDMTATTEIYVKLQSVYRDQAVEDLKQMRSLVPTDAVDDDDLQSFCSNIFAIGHFTTRSLQEEFQKTPPPELMDDLSMVAFDAYEVSEHTPLVWYLGIRACQMFFAEEKRYPGAVSEKWEDDIPKLQEHVEKATEHYGLRDNDLIKSALLDKEMRIAHELTRYANAEIHNIASVIGGVASQEAVKLITNQYVPLNNTYVYNGIASVGGIYRF